MEFSTGTKSHFTRQKRLKKSKKKKEIKGEAKRNKISCFQDAERVGDEALLRQLRKNICFL